MKPYLLVIIVVCVYSLVLTIKDLIKDGSSYSFGIETVDVIIDGPVCWLVMAVCGIIRLIVKTFKLDKKEKKKKKKECSEEKINKTVKRFFKVYKHSKIYKNKMKRNDPPMFLPDEMSPYSNAVDYYNLDSLDNLCIKNVLYEKLNHKISGMMYNYKDIFVKCVINNTVPLKIDEKGKKEYSDYFLDFLQTHDVRTILSTTRH